MVKPLKVGMKVCVQGGMGINYLVVEDVNEREFTARFLTGSKHQVVWPISDYGDQVLPAKDE